MTDLARADLILKVSDVLNDDELGKFKFGEENVVTANLRYYRIRGTIHI